MITIRTLLRSGMAASIVLLAPGPISAARADSAGDAGRVMAAARALPRTIAILPVVSVAGNADAERTVERSWPALRDDAGARWLGADSVRTLLAHARGSDATLAARAGASVWLHGALEPALAARIASALGVDGVMSVRIDRWEIADGGRAMVGATAVLTGADGTRLWSSTDAAGCGLPRTSERRNFTADLDWIWTPDVEPAEHAQEKLDCALVSLLAGWSAALPAPAAEPVGDAPATIETVSVD